MHLQFRTKPLDTISDLSPRSYISASIEKVKFISKARERIDLSTVRTTVQRRGRKEGVEEEEECHSVHRLLFPPPTIERATRGLVCRGRRLCL